MLRLLTIFAVLPHMLVYAILPTLTLTLTHAVLGRCTPTTATQHTYARARQGTPLSTHAT
jgi:hypothetical protein